MREKLWDKICLINSEYQISVDQLRLMQKEIEEWEDYSELARLAHVDSLRKLQTSNGIESKRLAESFIVHPQIIAVDNKIPQLCWSLFERPGGRLLACEGVRHQRSACPPFSPSPDATRNMLDEAKAVVVIRADGLTNYDQQRQLHHTLLAFEQHLSNNNFNVIQSWSAGPCRICEPEDDCLGQGKCRQPKKRRFSMEGSGMAVFLTCERIAELTGDNSWRLELIENWGLETRSRETFSSVIAIAVS